MGIKNEGFMDKNFTPLTITGDNRIDSKKKNIFQKMAYEYKNNRHKRKKYNIIGGTVLTVLLCSGLGVGLYFGLRPKATQPEDDVYNAMKADYASKGLDYSYDDFKQDQAAQQKKLSLEELNNKTLRAYLKKLLAASATVKETDLYKNADKTAASQYDAAVNNGNALLGKITDNDDSSEAHDQYLVAINDLVSTLQKLGFKKQSDILAERNQNADNLSNAAESSANSDPNSNDPSSTPESSSTSYGNSYGGGTSGDGSYEPSDDTSENNSSSYTPSFGSSDISDNYFIPDVPTENIGNEDDYSKNTQEAKSKAQKELDDCVNNDFGTNLTVDEVTNSVIFQIKEACTWIRNNYGYPNNEDGAHTRTINMICDLEKYGRGRIDASEVDNEYPEFPLDEQVEKLISTISTRRPFIMIEPTNEDYNGVWEKWWRQESWYFNAASSVSFEKASGQLGTSPLSTYSLIEHVLSSEGNKFNIYLHPTYRDGSLFLQVVDVTREVMEK